MSTAEGRMHQKTLLVAAIALLLCSSVPVEGRLKRMEHNGKACSSVRRTQATSPFYIAVLWRLRVVSGRAIQQRAVGLIWGICNTR